MVDLVRTDDVVMYLVCLSKFHDTVVAMIRASSWRGIRGVAAVRAQEEARENQADDWAYGRYAGTYDTNV